MDMDEIARWLGYAALVLLAGAALWWPLRRLANWYLHTTLAEFTLPLVAPGIYLNNLSEHLVDPKGRRYVPRFFGLGVFRFYVGVMWVETKERPNYVIAEDDE